MGSTWYGINLFFLPMTVYLLVQQRNCFWQKFSLADIYIINDTLQEPQILFLFSLWFFLTYSFASREFKVMQYSFINTTRLHSNTHLQLHSVPSKTSILILWFSVKFFQSVTFPFSIVATDSMGYHK